MEVKYDFVFVGTLSVGLNSVIDHKDKKKQILLAVKILSLHLKKFCILSTQYIIYWHEYNSSLLCSYDLQTVLNWHKWSPFFPAENSRHPKLLPTGVSVPWILHYVRRGTSGQLRQPGAHQHPGTRPGSSAGLPGSGVAVPPDGQGEEWARSGHREVAEAWSLQGRGPSRSRHRPGNKPNTLK